MSGRWFGICATCGSRLTAMNYCPWCKGGLLSSIEDLVTMDTCAARLEAAERERDALRGIVELMDIDGNRQCVTDWCDNHVRILCEEYGYGRVLDSAARQWREKDPNGALLVGPCVADVRSAVRSDQHADHERDQ